MYVIYIFRSNSYLHSGGYLQYCQFKEHTVLKQHGALSSIVYGDNKLTG